MKTCENNGCSNKIDIPSLDCPGQCLPCAIKSRERVAVWRQKKIKAAQERKQLGMSVFSKGNN